MSHHHSYLSSELICVGRNRFCGWSSGDLRLESCRDSCPARVSPHPNMYLWKGGRMRRQSAPDQLEALWCALVCVSVKRGLFVWLKRSVCISIEPYAHTHTCSRCGKGRVRSPRMSI